MTRALVLALLTVVAPSAVAAGDGPEEVIRALYKAHRPWEHKELNLANRAVLSRYFSPELTKLFLKNAQIELDCPKGDQCGLDFDPILGAQVFQLIQLKNGWRIDDIIYTEDNASLKAVLIAIYLENKNAKGPR